MDAIAFRPAKPEDAAALAERMTELGYPTSAEAMARRLRAILPREDFLTIVAVAGGRVVGMIGAQLCPGYNRDGVTARISALVVAPAWRGRGAGRELVRQLEDRLRGIGATGLFVNSRHHRVEAHRFYERLGYEENGRRFVKSL